MWRLEHRFRQEYWTVRPLSLWLFREKPVRSLPFKALRLRLSIPLLFLILLRLLLWLRVSPAIKPALSSWVVLRIHGRQRALLPRELIRQKLLLPRDLSAHSDFPVAWQMLQGQWALTLLQYPFWTVLLQSTNSRLQRLPLLPERLLHSPLSSITGLQL